MEDSGPGSAWCPLLCPEAWTCCVSAWSQRTNFFCVNFPAGCRHGRTNVLARGRTECRRLRKRMGLCPQRKAHPEDTEAPPASNTFSNVLDAGDGRGVYRTERGSELRGLPPPLRDSGKAKRDRCRRAAIRLESVIHRDRRWIPGRCYFSPTRKHSLSDTDAARWSKCGWNYPTHQRLMLHIG